MVGSHLLNVWTIQTVHHIAPRKVNGSQMLEKPTQGAIGIEGEGSIQHFVDSSQCP
jgi:hypothetical protein